MNIHELVDDLYEAFADRIGEPLSASARDLPRALQLAPRAVPWSRVFSHEVTLGAPALFAEAMIGVPRSVVRDAVLAHLLGVVDAFGTDRIEDEQIDASPSVFAVLSQARRERDRAIARVYGAAPPPDGDFRATDAQAIRAIRNERAVLLSARPVDIKAYETASLEKQGTGILASVALARVAGWSDRKCRAVRATLGSVCLGLQIADDVVDWENDLQRGGAWAVCLMRGQGPSSGLRMKEPIRNQVLRSGILAVMLKRAWVHMRSARRLSTVLAVKRLASWAGDQETRLAALVAAESRSAGYAVRAHALSAWASEVLG
jgi:hypothetical protein